jgi:hypothetical protein
VLEPIFDAGSEVLQACDDQEQFASLRGQIGVGLQLPFEVRRAVLRTANPKRELILVEKTFA